MMQCAILPLFVVAAQAALHSVSNAGVELRSSSLRIRPELESSDKKFFGKDYAWDKRPVADKYYVFNHPYPAVQDSGDFDRDFVKDENSDGGRWKAQMDYDTLRSKIRKAKDKLGDLKKNMEKEYEDWMNAKKKAADGETEYSKARGESDGARHAAEDAVRRVNELEGNSGKPGTAVGGEIGEAVKKVQDEMSDLEKCKKALAEAKKRLKGLLKEKEEFEKRQVEVKKEKEQAEKKAAEEQKKKKEQDEKEKVEAQKKAEKVAKAAKKEEDESKFDEAAWQKKLNAEKKDHSEALQNYEKELTDVKKTEDELARAAANLRKYRRPPYVDDNGGVYYEAENSGFTASASILVVLTVLASLFSA